MKEEIATLKWIMTGFAVIVLGWLGWVTNKMIDHDTTIDTTLATVVQKVDDIDSYLKPKAFETPLTTNLADTTNQ